MVRSMISHFSLSKSLYGEVLKTVVYIFNKLTISLMNSELTKSQALNSGTFGVFQLKHDLIGHMKQN
ncbi:hypothetical protein CR513_02899, partial [Mucuna pruriens]